MAKGKGSWFMKPDLGIDDGNLFAIDKFVDVSRQPNSPHFVFVTHTQGFKDKEAVDVVIVTVRHYVGNHHRHTERIQFRVWGIIPAYALKRAIGAFLTNEGYSAAVFEIERMIYK